MSNRFGMPGLGGSLGMCAFCGKTFLENIITGAKIISFHQDGIDQTLYAHKDCMSAAEKVSRIEDLPDGPLRRVLQEHNDRIDAKAKEAHVS